MFSQLLQYLGVVAGERFGDLGGKFRFSLEEGREGIREGFSYFRCHYFVFCNGGVQRAYEWREEESSEIRQDQEVFRREQGKDQRVGKMAGNEYDQNGQLGDEHG